jgi:hypothetical protein
LEVVVDVLSSLEVVVDVLSAFGVAVLVVGGDVVHLEALGIVDAEDLDGAVLDGLESDVSACTMI